MYGWWIPRNLFGWKPLSQPREVSRRRAGENLERLVAALAAHGPYLRGAPSGLPFRFDTETLEGGLNFTLTTRLGDIDLLGEVVGGGRYEDLIPHSVEITLFGLPCRCLDLPTHPCQTCGWTSEGSRCHQRASSHPGRDFRWRSVDGQEKVGQGRMGRRPTERQPRYLSMRRRCHPHRSPRAGTTGTLRSTPRRSAHFRSRSARTGLAEEAKPFSAGRYGRE